MRRRQLRIRRWLVVASGLVTLAFASSASAIPVVDTGGGSTAPEGMTSSQYRSIIIHGQALNKKYRLGVVPATSFKLSRPPDVQDAATVVQTPPDVLERYASVHPYGAGLTSASSSEVVRPPDVRDAAYAARTTLSSQSSGFDWGDYGIGIGSGSASSFSWQPASALARSNGVECKPHSFDDGEGMDERASGPLVLCYTTPGRKE